MGGRWWWPTLGRETTAIPVISTKGSGWRPGWRLGYLVPRFWACPVSHVRRTTPRTSPPVRRSGWRAPPAAPGPHPQPRQLRRPRPRPVSSFGCGSVLGCRSRRLSTHLAPKKRSAPKLFAPSVATAAATRPSRVNPVPRGITRRGSGRRFGAWHGAHLPQVSTPVVPTAGVFSAVDPELIAKHRHHR